AVLPFDTLASRAYSGRAGFSLLSDREILAGERAADQLDRFLAAVERDERAHARALALAEQRFVQCAEPVAQVRKSVALADLVDLVLDRLRVGIGGQRFD